ncbi:MAG: hypothetical protein A3H45_06665 [Ignavibacteria bacterium RIFCSPLOWO2_02_FULL_55_14]|nr:MAG: hypothetical protein A3H45_06665 [Ignavibacteria bacterium RIFCSPLOWO2_02_FULL_55_14]OGU75427.1 MAG: hypothetical protein A3G43_03090 [Ignavibacteria bacterium RIFCSPLOWO2_12_FULL_56_21]
MRDPNNLPYLLRLLDDESEVVRENVLTQLSAFGPFLEIELSRFNIPTSPQQRLQLRNLLGQHSRRWLIDHWPSWKEETEDKARLERALALIAEFQYGPGYPSHLTPSLDRLAGEFRKRTSGIDPLALAAFLFKTKGLQGAETDYFNPFHSNLVYVLEEGHGNPLSLTAIYMLVGHRFGLEIEGCNFPGHFLARTRFAEKTFVVDCYNGGRFLDKNDLVSVNKGPAMRIGELLEADCPAEKIIARSLNNLVHAYRQEDQPENVDLMQRLLKEIDDEPPAKDEGEEQ